jgi:hypothetical protein
VRLSRRIQIAPVTSVVTVSGSTVQNIQRQPSQDSTAPPMVGPIAGATAMTMVIVPMVAPRRWGGTRRITEVISSGSITAVPKACTTRPTSGTLKPGASPLINVPRLNSVSEVRKTLEWGEPLEHAQDRLVEDHHEGSGDQRADQQGSPRRRGVSGWVSGRGP